MVAAVATFLAVGAGLDYSPADQFFLNLQVDFPRNNGFVVTFHIVLRHAAVVLDSGFIQEIGGVSLLEKSITDVFLISENLVDGAGMPLSFACSGENAVTLQTGGNLVHAEAFQIFAIDAFDDFCLLRVDDQIPIRVLRISEEAVVVDLHFALLIAELDAHLHVLAQGL